MKKILFLMCATLIFTFQGMGQETTPKAVKEGLKAKYPKVKKAEWVKTSETQWQADFRMNDQEVEAVFDENGKWLGSTTEIDNDNLPEAVQKAIAEKYNGYTPSAIKLVEVGNQATMYKIDLKKGEREVETMFYQDGRIVMQTDELPEAEEMEMEKME